MIGRLNEYLVATPSIPNGRAPAPRAAKQPPRRLRMARWAQQIRRG